MAEHCSAHRDVEMGLQCFAWAIIVEIHRCPEFVKTKRKEWAANHHSERPFDRPVSRQDPAPKPKSTFRRVARCKERKSIDMIRMEMAEEYIRFDGRDRRHKGIP
jgi:hypothetical protein